jgi:phospholipid transport system substrate-binding protein
MRDLIERSPAQADGRCTSGRSPVGRRLLLAGGLLMWPALSWTQGASQEAQKSVSELYAGLQVIMRMGSGAAFPQKFNQLAPVIDRTFDLDAILRSSVGLRWNSLDPASQRNLSAVFRTFTIASWTSNFGNDGGQRFEVLPQVRASGADQIVASRLVPSSGDPVRIDYVMRGGPGGWRIVDVLLNGSISRVAVQRSDFRSLLTSGSATPLIDSLRQKVVDLSGGTMRS